MRGAVAPPPTGRAVSPRASASTLTRTASSTSPARSTGSTAGSASDREARPAPAGRDRVRVLDLERLADEVVDEIDHRAVHVLQRDLVDEDGRAVALDD